MNVFATQQISQFLIAYISFVIYYKELKIAQTTQINQFFQLLNLNRPIRLTQCCTHFNPFGNKSFCFRNFHII